MKYLMIIKTVNEYKHNIFIIPMDHYLPLRVQLTFTCFKATGVETHIYDENKQTWINFDLENADLDFSLIYIYVINYKHNLVKIYIDNIIKIMETKEYKFIGEYCDKFFFVNKSVNCDNVYNYNKYELLFKNNKQVYDMQQLVDHVPAIIYVSVYDTIDHREDLTKIFKFKKLLSITPTLTTMPGVHYFNFYIVVKRENLTKCALRVTTSTVLKK